MTRPRQFVVSMFVLSAAMGVFEAYVRLRGEDSRVIAVVSMFTYPLFFSWCKADAAHRAIRPPPGAPLLVWSVCARRCPVLLFADTAAQGRTLSTAQALGVFLLMGITTGVADAVVLRLFAS